VRSQTITLPPGALGALTPREWRFLARVTDETERARTLRLRVSRSAGESEAPWSCRLPCGIWWTKGNSSNWIGSRNDQSNGVLRIRLGSRGMSRVLHADLASGDYQLPPCEQVYIDAARYTPGGDAGALASIGLDQPTEVQAELSDGATDDYSPLMVTAPVRWTGSVDPPITVAVPSGAYAWDAYPDANEDATSGFLVTPPSVYRGTDGFYPMGPIPVISDVLRVSWQSSTVAAFLVFYVR
jgi:hypothetical protein